MCLAISIARCVLLIALLVLLLLALSFLFPLLLSSLPLFLLLLSPGLCSNLLSQSRGLRRRFPPRLLFCHLLLLRLLQLLCLLQSLLFLLLFFFYQFFLNLCDLLGSLLQSPLPQDYFSVCLFIGIYLVLALLYLLLRGIRLFLGRLGIAAGTWAVRPCPQTALLLFYILRFHQDHAIEGALLLAGLRLCGVVGRRLGVRRSLPGRRPLPPSFLLLAVDWCLLSMLTLPRSAVPPGPDVHPGPLPAVRSATFTPALPLSSGPIVRRALRVPAGPRLHGRPVDSPLVSLLFGPCVPSAAALLSGLRCPPSASVVPARLGPPWRLPVGLPNPFGTLFVLVCNLPFVRFGLRGLLSRPSAILRFAAAFLRLVGRRRGGAFCRSVLGALRGRLDRFRCRFASGFCLWPRPKLTATFVVSRFFRSGNCAAGLLRSWWSIGLGPFAVGVRVRIRVLLLLVFLCNTGLLCLASFFGGRNSLVGRLTLLFVCRLTVLLQCPLVTIIPHQLTVNKACLERGSIPLHGDFVLAHFSDLGLDIVRPRQRGAGNRLHRVILCADPQAGERLHETRALVSFWAVGLCCGILVAHQFGPRAFLRGPTRARGAVPSSACARLVAQASLRQQPTRGRRAARGVSALAQHHHAAAEAALAPSLSAARAPRRRGALEPAGRPSKAQ
mmetsp:Transcript_88419/g.253258  ORF Transcript_88419/g.253258 Transcript_88419/m.253258 type:complete len:668 (+) Transcript_88419:1202-3205(+)